MSAVERRGPGSVVAAVAGGVGLAAILVLTTWALVVESELPPEPLEHVSFGVVLGAPFAISLLVLTTPSQRLRGGVWIGAGLVGAASPFAIFSFVAIYFIPLYLALVVAGVRALAATHEERGAVVIPLIALVATAAIAIAVLQSVRDPACWYRSGDTWERRPFSTSIALGDTYNEGVCGHFVSVAGGAVSIGTWALAGLGVYLAGRRRPAIAGVPT